MVGFNEAYLRSIDARVPQHSVVVLEEPDIIRKRGLAEKATPFGCLAGIVPAEYQQAPAFLEVGTAIHQASGFEAVVPGLEYGVQAAAALATKFGLPGATEGAAAILRDKALLRATTARAGVRNPRWAHAGSAKDIVAFGRGGPVVVKPANREASVGVRVLDASGPADAAAAWQATVTAREYGQVPDRELSWHYLVEERLRGPEYSVEALVRDGEVIFANVTEKAVIPGQLPVELGHCMPADGGTPGVWSRCLRTLVDAVEFGTGMLHAEWILTADGPALVECAGRCPGDRIADLIDLAYGTRIRVALIELLAGRPVTLPREPLRGSAIRFITAPSGRVVRVDGVDAALAMPGVHDVSVRLAAGAEAKPWLSSWDRPGHVLATGVDASQARQRAEAAAAAVRIVTEIVTETGAETGAEIGTEGAAR